MKGYMYILHCSDGSYYTGSTTDLERRLAQLVVSVVELYQNGNYTKKRLPVKLVYFEEYQRIDEAFYREKQVQGWSRRKKEALINNMPDELKKYAECMNESHYKNFKPAPFDYDQGADNKAVAERNCSVTEHITTLAERSRSQRSRSQRSRSHRLNNKRTNL